MWLYITTVADWHLEHVSPYLVPYKTSMYRYLSGRKDQWLSTVISPSSNPDGPRKSAGHKPAHRSQSFRQKPAIRRPSKAHSLLM